MLEITEAAAKRMLGALLEFDEGDKQCFRILVTDDGAQLVRDEQQSGDVAFEHEERVVLVMDSETADFLKDEKIDYDEATSTLIFV